MMKKFDRDSIAWYFKRDENDLERVEFFKLIADNAIGKIKELKSKDFDKPTNIEKEKTIVEYRIQETKRQIKEYEILFKKEKLEKSKAKLEQFKKELHLLKTDIRAYKNLIIKGYLYDLKIAKAQLKALR